MPVNLVVPQLGESVVEATVGPWRKSKGDFVNVGEVVVELETDKVNLEIGATHKGVFARIERKEGETVTIGDVLAVIEESAADAALPSEERNAAPTLPHEQAASDSAGRGLPTDSGSQAPANPRATPSARRLAMEKGVDLRKMPPSPTGAPIRPGDVEKYTEKQKIQPDPVPPAAALPAASTPNGEASRREERVRMSRRRLTIATRLVEALRTAAVVTTFNDVDMSAVMELRGRHKESFKTHFGVSLGIVSFFVKAVIAALRALPRLNAEIQGDEMVLKHYYDIGVAVGAPEGLVVPVLHDADRMSFREIEQAIKGYAVKAADGTLTLEDLRGGTFTISNGGVFGSLLSTPILNPPQVGILGLHRIEERPVSVSGEIRIHPMMYVALSYDHRIVDGRESVQFLKHVKALIENPEDLLLQG